jgi:hypothetical protein
VRLQHIKGHAGHEGNEGADRLAGRGTGMPATEERDWESLERTLRAHEALRPPQEGGSVEISDLDLNVGGCRSILFNIIIDTCLNRCMRKALSTMMS